jgi:hypothetical protein
VVIEASGVDDVGAEDFTGGDVDHSDGGLVADGEDAAAGVGGAGAETVACG